NSASKLMLVGPDRSGERPAHQQGGNLTGRAGLKAVPIVDFSSLDTAAAGFPDTLGGNPAGREGVEEISAGEEAIIIYTSGTTGKPKGCLLTHGHLLANAEQITNWMGFGPDDRLLTVMPLFHMNAVT